MRTGVDRTELDGRHALVSAVVLAFTYRLYARGVLATAHAVSSQPKLLAVFLVVMTAVPLGLLLV